MTQPTNPPSWAKLFEVTEVSRWDASNNSQRAWFQYTLESDHSKMVGRRFGTSTEVWSHANARAEKLNERLLGNRSSKAQATKKR